MNNDTCVKCGETREGIKKHKMICGSVDSLTGELNQEWGRHRFKPYSPKELSLFALAEQEESAYWGRIAKQHDVGTNH